MLPYLKLQLAYLLSAGALTAVAWTLVARMLPDLRPLWRALVTLAALYVPGAALVVLIRAVDHTHSTWQFAVIAHGYYAAGLWVPLAILLGAPAARRTRGRLDVPALALATALLAGAGYALFVEPNRMQVVERTLRFEAWPEGAPPLTLVHVSDLQTVGRCGREVEAARTINALQPDLVVVTGDYVAGPFGEPEPAIEAARAFLGSLRARLGVVCVPGHSEPERIRARIFEGLDVHYLRNETLEWALEDGAGPRTLRIFGATERDPDFSRLAPPSEPGTVTLVATHVPDLSWDLAGRGVDLHLAGHTHGGQIAFPFVGPPMTLSRLPGSFARGLHPFGDHWLHVSPGLGMEGHHAPRIRFLCPPEIDVLTLAGGPGGRPSGGPPPEPGTR